jgi:hypothetical protein
MYAIDRSPGNDATLGRVEFALFRSGTASRALRKGEQVPAVNPHVRPGHGGLSEDCHKSPRSLPASAPGIPSSARDHSLAPWLTTRFAWEVPRFRGIQIHARRGLSQSLTTRFAWEVPRFRGIDSGLSPEHAHGPIYSGAGAPGSSYFGFWILDFGLEEKNEENTKIKSLIRSTALCGIRFWIGRKKENETPRFSILDSRSRPVLN